MASGGGHRHAQVRVWFQRHVKPHIRSHVYRSGMSLLLFASPHPRLGCASAAKQTKPPGSFAHDQTLGVMPSWCPGVGSDGDGGGSASGGIVGISFAAVVLAVLLVGVSWPLCRTMTAARVCGMWGRIGRCPTDVYGATVAGQRRLSSLRVLLVVVSMCASVPCASGARCLTTCCFLPAVAHTHTAPCAHDRACDAGSCKHDLLAEAVGETRTFDAPSMRAGHV